MQCPTREVTLRADPEYTSTDVASVDSVRQRKRELSASEISRPQKKPKADPAPKAEHGKLSDKQLGTLAADKTKLGKLLKKFKSTNHKANSHELVDCITK